MTADFLGNVKGNVTGQVSDISNFTTDDLREKNKLYFTDLRARKSISLINNDSKILTYDDKSGQLTYTPLTNNEITKKIILAESGGITRDNKGAIKIGQEVNTSSNVKFDTVIANDFMKRRR